MVYSMANLDARTAWRRVSLRISILFTASCWSHLCLNIIIWSSWRTHFRSMHLRSPYWPIIWSDGMVCRWMHGHLLLALMVQRLLDFCCNSSTLCSSPAKSCFSADNSWPHFASIVCSDLPSCRKCTVSVLTSTFSRSLSDRKRLFNGYRATGTPPYTSFCCRWAVGSYWSCIGSCNWTCNLCTTQCLGV